MLCCYYYSTPNRAFLLVWRLVAHQAAHREKWVIMPPSPPVEIIASDPSDLPPWSWRDTLTGTLLTLVPLLSFNLAVIALNNGMATPKKPLDPSVDMVSAVIQFIFLGVLEAVFLIAPLYFARRRAGPNRENIWWALGLRPTNLRMAVVLVIAGMALTLVAGLVIDYFSQLIFHTVLSTNLDQLIQQIRIAPRTILAAGLVAALVAPICEEIFFRGFLLQGLRHVVSAPWAIVISAAIFAFAHLSLGSTILLFLLGLMLGYLRVSQRSLWPSIALHMLNNLIGFIQIVVIVAQHGK